MHLQLSLSHLRRMLIGWAQADAGRCVDVVIKYTTEEGKELGKAIEIQSISWCQEEIKGQIAFLIRAQALR